MIINVQDLREARKLMTINVQLMIINVQDLREAQKTFFSSIKIGCAHFLSKESVSLPTYMAFLPFWSTGTALPSALLT